MVHGFLSLWFGSLVLAFHHVWSGFGSVLTFVGCLYTVKAVLCFVLPSTQMRTLGRVSHDRPGSRPSGLEPLAGLGSAA